MRVDLLVGLDAVTNRQTLERLQELESKNRRFRPRVFWNSTSGLFHPKISEFTYKGGGRRLIVGSGNLTPGGLRGNFEGFTIVTAEDGELDVSAIEDFIERHGSNIRCIDEEALERAARNLVRPIRGVGRPSHVVLPKPRTGAASGQRGELGGESDRVLVAQVPRAGGRWGQVHLNADVVREFFRISDHRTHRVYLTEIGRNGDRGPVEVRPCVFSETNRNLKIEIGAVRGRAYPEVDHPLLVCLECGLRTFYYVLVMPGEVGYDATKYLAVNHPSVGRGVRRAIVNRGELERCWPECPLLITEDSDGQEL